MKRVDFDYFGKHVHKIIKDRYSTFCKDSCATECKFRYTQYSRNYLDTLYDEFTSIENILTELCYDENDLTKVLDQHKVAACFCASIINKKPFSFELGSNISDAILLSNYDVAFQSALRIVHLYLFDAYNTCKDSDAKNKQKAKEIAKRLKCHGFNLSTPPTSSSFPSQYDKGRLKALCTNDIYGIKLDLLHFADTLFWIEYYNRQRLEETVYPNINLDWKLTIPKKDK